MVKSVLIAHTPIPTNIIGSWNVMVTSFVENNPGVFNYIITPKPFKDTESSKHFHVKVPTFAPYALEKLFKHYRFRNYYAPIRNLLRSEPDTVLLLNIFDNTGCLTALDYFLKRDKFRNRVKIIFFFRGFSLNSNNYNYFDMIDTLVVLTKISYRIQKDNAPSMVCKVKQIYNGIDSKKFYKVPTEEKKQLKNKLFSKDDKIFFLWLSQDRPKKGLHIILEAWKKIIVKNTDVELVIIGTTPKEKTKQVTYLGRFPNNQLPAFYQATDFFLFPTLWHEGFGLALAEALKSGSICLASDIDPMAEILENGKYGRLVDFPNNPDSWVEAIEQELKKYRAAGGINIYEKDIPPLVYDFDEWSENVLNLLQEEERAFIQM